MEIKCLALCHVAGGAELRLMATPKQAFASHLL